MYITHVCVCESSFPTRGEPPVRELNEMKSSTHYNTGYIATVKYPHDFHIIWISNIEHDVTRDKLRHVKT